MKRVLFCVAAALTTAVVVAKAPVSEEWLRQPREDEARRAAYFEFLKDSVDGNIDAFVIFDERNRPIKAYGNVVDCIGYMNDHEGWWQQTRLYYKRSRVEDSLVWRPAASMILEDERMPRGLADRFLEKTVIYIVMQYDSPDLIDRAYYNKSEAEQRAAWRNTKMHEVAIHQRNKKSYDELARMQKAYLESLGWKFKN